MKVLHVIASPSKTEESVSKQLAMEFFQALMAADPEVDINNVDLYQNKPPFLSAEALGYFWKPVLEPGYAPNKQEEMAVNYSHNNAPALQEADALVITTPVWTNGMPAILKAWLDQVIVPGAMFDVGPEGVRPLHHLKSVVLLASSGDVYKEDDPADGLTPAIRAAFAYIGVDDIQIAWADGQDKSRHADAAQRLAVAVEAAKEIAEELAAG
ncbi:MAG: NAD(P)H-dependent oxidoreductase [Kiritimatiellae bacterium]|nr:NAD(P)H-dependent oxidoreductase [Kiritimatiellia bacterium]